MSIAMENISDSPAEAFLLGLFLILVHNHSILFSMEVEGLTILYTVFSFEDLFDIILKKKFTNETLPIVILLT